MQASSTTATTVVSRDPTEPQPPVAARPGQRPLHLPSVSPQPLGGLDAMPMQITAAMAVIEVGSGRSAASCFALVRSSACAFNPPHVLPR